MFDILKENKPPIDQACVLTLTKNNSESIDYVSKKFCKIYKFSQEWNFDEILLNVSKLDPKDYPIAFIFIIETTQIEDQATINILKKFLVNFAENRSIILQLTFKNYTKFYYKEEDSKEFQDVEEQQANNSKDFDNFSSFLWLYLNNNVELESLNEKSLKNIQNSSLIFKFLRILELDDQFVEKLVLKCAAEGSISDLLSAANGFLDDNGEICWNELKWYLRCEFSSSSVLMTAVESSNQQIIDFLIKYCSACIQQLSFDHQVVISTFLYSTSKINVLCDLLELADFPFPAHLKSKNVTDEKLLKIIAERTNFHKNIESKNINFESKTKPEIEKFKEKFPKLKFAYNLNNKSALGNALDLKKLEAFYLLKSLRFCDQQIENFKIDTSDEEIEVKRSDTAYKQRIQNVTHSKSDQKNSVLLLTTKSSIYHRNENNEAEAKQRKKIREWYEDIYKTRFGLKLLDAAAQCDKIKIIFDFGCGSIENIDPSSSSSSTGVTYPISKWIFVGADYTKGIEKEQKIKGVIAHEICHYVMRLVYQNNDNPYYGDDDEAKQQFEEIATAIKSMLFPQNVQKPSPEDDQSDESNKIFSTVYTLYKPEAWHPELIVRPFHIQAQFDNNQEVLIGLEQKYDKLFKFVEKQILTELEKFNLRQRENVENVNKLFGIIAKLESSKLKLSRSKNLNFMMSHQLVVVSTNSSSLFLVNMRRSLSKMSQKLLNIRNIIMTSSSIKNDYTKDQFKEILNQNQSLNVIVDCTKGFETIIEFISSNNKFILVVSAESQRKDLKEKLLNLKLDPVEVEINYDWKILTPGSKKFLLDTKVNFQNNSSFSLLELINGNSPEPSQISPNDECFERIIDDKLLNLLIDKSEIIVNNCFRIDDFFKFMFQPRSLTKITEEESDEVQIVETMPATANVESKPFLVIVQNEISKFFTGNSSQSNQDLSMNQQQVKQIVQTKSEIMELCQMIDGLTNDKYVLISDKAGTGKSWIMKFITNSLIMKHPDKWISYVDLKQFIFEFMQQNSEFKFEEFLINKILKLTTKFEAEIFKKLYKNGKVCILFDGFDEIAPDCAEFVLKLFKSFKQNAGNQLWITTREYFELDLKELLRMNTTYKLDEFTKDDGIKLIASFWVRNKMRQRNYEIPNSDYSKNILKYKNKAKLLVKRIPKSTTNSIGLPQFYKMIADITQDKKDSVIDFTTFKLFEECVNIQYERWSKEKGDIWSRSNTESQNKMLTYQTLHQLIAIMGLFPDETEYCDLSIGGLKQWTEDQIIACGQLIKKGEKYFFNHETFRELYAAKFILRTLENDRIHPNLWKYLFEFLTVKKYGIIRLFLNEALKDEKISKVIILNFDKLIETLKNKKHTINYTILTNTLDEGLDYLADLIAGILKHLKIGSIGNPSMINPSLFILSANYDRIFSQVQNAFFKRPSQSDLYILFNDHGTFLSVITSISDADIIDEFLKKFKKMFNSSYLKILLKSKDANYENILFYLFRSKNANVSKFENTFQILEEYLTSKEIMDLARENNKYQLNLLQLIFSLIYVPKIKIMWTKLDEIYKKSVNKSGSLIDILNENGLQSKEKIEFYEALLEPLLATFKNRDDLKDLLMLNNESGDNFIHHLLIFNNSEIIDFTISKIKENFSYDQYEEILKAKGFKGRNLLQLAFSSKNLKIHQILWNIFQEFCSTDEDFLEFLKEVDNQNCNVFHVAAAFTSKENFEFLINELEKFTSNEEIQIILKTFGMAKRNLLQSAALQNKSVEIHEHLWKIMRKYFNSNELLDMIKHTENFGYNLLFCVVEFSSKEILELTWKEIKIIFDDTKAQDFSNSVNNKGENIFHILMKSQDSEKLEFLWTELNKFLNIHQFKKLLSQKTTEGEQNVLHYAAKCDKIEFHETFWELLLKTFENREELKGLIKLGNKNGNNFLHCLINFNNPEIIEFSITKIQENFSSDQYEEILKSKGETGRNLLQLAACSSNDIKTHQILWQIFRDFYKSDEESDKFLEFLIEVDDENNNVFHNAACFSSKKIFQFMIHEVAKLASKEEIKFILKTLGTENINLLQSAARHNKSVELHEYLWTTMQNYFNSQEIFDMIKHADVNGKNLLNDAIKNNNIYAFYVIWDKIRKIMKHEKSLNEKLNKTFIDCEEFLKIKVNDNFKKDFAGEFTIKLNEFIREFELQNFFKQIQRIRIEEITIKDLKYLNRLAFCNTLKYHENTWQILIHSCKEIEELRQLINFKDFNGNNYLHYLIKNGNYFTIKYTLNTFPNILSDEQFRQVLKSKGQLDRNLLQIAAEKVKDLKIHKLLWTKFQKYFKSKQEFREIVKHEDKSGFNVFHIAVCVSTAEIFNFMIETVEKIMTKDEIKDLLTFGNGNILQVAATLNKSLTMHETLWKIIPKYFRSSEILDMIHDFNSSGDNVLHNAVFWNTKDILEFTWTQIKEFIKTKENQTEYLTKKGHLSLNLLQLSRENQSSDPEVRSWVVNVMNEYKIYMILPN